MLVIIVLVTGVGIGWDGNLLEALHVEVSVDGSELCFRKVGSRVEDKLAERWELSFGLHGAQGQLGQYG